MRLSPLILVLAFLLPGPLAAQPTTAPRAPSDYRQSEAVLAHYPAVPDVRLDSPAFRTSEPSLTSQDAMMAFLTGKLKLTQGEMSSLLPFANAAKELIASASLVDTGFPKKA